MTQEPRIAAAPIQNPVRNRKAMEITSSRISVYEVVVDLKRWDDRLTHQVPGFPEALIRLLSTTADHKCMAGEEGGFHAEVRRGTNFGHVIEHVLLELIRLAHPDKGEFTGWTRARGDREYVIHYGAPDFLTGRLAAVFAVDLVKRLQRGESPELEPYLRDLERPEDYFSTPEEIPAAGPPASFQDPIDPREPAPPLAEWQRRSFSTLMGKLCSRLPAVNRRWQETFSAFGGEFARGILDKVAPLNPDGFSRQVLAGDLKAYFQGVANLSRMLRSLDIPLPFLTHAAWLYKNALLLEILEILSADDEGRAAAVGDLDDFYQNVLQAIRQGFARPAARPDSPDELKLCGFRTRNVTQGAVLVVDDDAMSRKVAQEILEFNGIATLGAKDGFEALAQLARHGSAVGVVLLDLVLPGMDGRSVCFRVLEGYPRARIILSSGYRLEDRNDLPLAEHRVCLLNKPYRSAELLTMVRDLLDIRAAAAASQ